MNIQMPPFHCFRQTASTQSFPVESHGGYGEHCLSMDAVFSDLIEAVDTLKIFFTLKSM